MALRRPKPAEPSDALVRIPAALTGAVATVQLSGDSSWKTWKFGNTDWQKEAWRLFDLIPELHKLAGRIGESVAKARLYVAEVSETGEEQSEVTDDQIARLAAIPLGTGPKRDGCLYLAGVDLAVGGECWIVGEGAATDPLGSEGTWFVVTGSAFKRTGGQGSPIEVKRPKTRGGGWLTLSDGQDVLIRCWREHPNDTDQADSFTRSAIVPLREIELLTKREFAELDSRLTGAGMMFVPEGIDFPREPGDPADTLAGFMAYLQRAAAASMRDQSTASAMVPIIASLPDQMMQYVDQMKPINFWSELSAEISPMKVAAIGRLASSAEIPAEVLTGIGDANHWTAWLISEEGTRWISGYLGLIADALTRGHLHLALAKLEIERPERYVYAFDVSGLAARPNRLDDALKLRALNLISDIETVKAGAFDEEQMPDETELIQQRLWELVKLQPDLVLDPAVQAALGLPQIESVGLPPTADQNADGDDPDSADGPPNDGAAPDLPANEARAISAALSARVSALSAPRAAAALPSPEAVFNAAAKLMVYRALELAGGRLSTPAERRGRWGSVPRHELHARVGPITRDKAEAVTAGAWNHIGAVAGDLGVDAEDLRALLEGYVLELLTRGMPHHDDLLFAALGIANRGRGLVAA